MFEETEEFEKHTKLWVINNYNVIIILILNLWFAYYKAKNNFKEWLKLLTKQEEYQIEENENRGIPKWY